MAKVSMVEREKKRLRVVAKYRNRREQIKRTIKDSHASEEQRATALAELNALPRNASPCRLRNRCSITGRARGVYRKFGLSRHKLREHAMRGDIPGLVKSSW